MSSKFSCNCGNTVCTNSFEGHGIYRLITDIQIDSLKDPITVDEVTTLWFGSPEMIKCNGCGCFYQWSIEDKEYIQYKRT